MAAVRYGVGYRLQHINGYETATTQLAEYHDQEHARLSPRIYYYDMLMAVTIMVYHGISVGYWRQTLHERGVDIVDDNE